MKKKKKKIFKKKSFYFEDYNEPENIGDKKIDSVTKISLNRVTFLFFIFLSLIFIFGIKITYLSLAPEINFYTDNTKKNILNDRRTVVDRHGSVLATNVILYDIGVRPKLLSGEEKKTFLIQLNLLFPELNLNEIKKKTR